MFPMTLVCLSVQQRWILHKQLKTDDRPLMGKRQDFPENLGCPPYSRITGCYTKTSGEPLWPIFTSRISSQGNRIGPVFLSVCLCERSIHHNQRTFAQKDCTLRGRGRYVKVQAFSLNNNSAWLLLSHESGFCTNVVQLININNIKPLG